MKVTGRAPYRDAEEQLGGAHRVIRNREKRLEGPSRRTRCPSCARGSCRQAGGQQGHVVVEGVGRGQYGRRVWRGTSRGCSRPSPVRPGVRRSEIFKCRYEVVCGFGSVAVLLAVRHGDRGAGVALADPVVDAAIETEVLVEVAVGVVEFEQPDVRGGETEVGGGLPLSSGNRRTARRPGRWLSSLL